MTDPAADMVNEAIRIIADGRLAIYDNPEDTFQVIADLWTTYLRRVGLDFTNHVPEQALTAGHARSLMVLTWGIRLTSPMEYPPDMDHRERLRMAEAEIVRLREELAAARGAKS